MTNTGELGTWLGMIAGLVGGLGTYLGGALGDRLTSRYKDPRWYVWLPAIATLCSIPFAFLFYLWPEGRPALLLSAPATLMGAMYLGPTFAITQGLVKLRMRAVASAILLFITNLIGLGLGPQTVGLVSDVLTPSYGAEAIRYALLSVVVAGSLWSILHYMIAARTLQEDLLAKEH